MKKITAFLMTLMLVLTATVANAAEYSVYFDNSASNWSKVNVYGWNGVDFGGWPGTAVTEKTSEGYYKVTVTADADPSTLGAKIIFNNGSAQTADLAWVTNGIYNKNGNTGNLYGGGTVEMYEFNVYFDNSTANWSKVNVYGWNGVNFGGWPGSEITEKTAEGYYKVTVKDTQSPAGANIIFNDGSAQTSDLVWQDNAVYNQNGFSHTYGETPEIPSTETLTYNVTVPAGTPACYIAGEMNSWGFTAMTMVDETHYTITFDNVTRAMKYKYTASESWDNVEMQADGVTDVLDRTYSENDVVAAWKGIATEEPILETLTYNVTVPVGTPACYIAGEMNSWGFTAMTMVDETHYTITLDNVTRAMKYKYTASESWDNVEMQADGVTDVLDRTYSENDVVATWKGITTEEPTPETLTYYVTVPAGTEACYIVGAFNEWSAFVVMDKVDDTHFTISIDNTTKSSEYKYTCGESWEYEEVTADGGQVANRTWSAEDVVVAWKATPSTEPETPETLTYNVTVPEGTYSCFIAGGMNSWTFTEMTRVDATHYTITFDDVTKSTEYKYFCGPDFMYAECWADLNYRSNRTYSENDVVEGWENSWTSVAGVEANDVKVYGANGVLSVRASEEVALYIYNAQGMLVKAVTVDGSADINLAAGLYIVNGTKVVVR